ncbi:DUF2325 domain-containing protein [Shouchella lonarensis]|uniref:DUF2325 domain-containing protein n=1 Tax=Shouchella lonarensis TaxID=1464122 RepID=A0A1G6GJS1_9BACI|nr:DUF2325 domain-containing protein [Shouchella lonarensis]SDB82247.1 hypothetical protein SAMN05421737_101161 [Shouchella lonarensis]
MDKERVLSEIREDIKRMANNIDDYSGEQLQKFLEGYGNLVKCLCSAIIEETVCIPERDTTPTQPERRGESVALPSEQQQYASDDGAVLPLSRKLRGGMLGGVVYMPEHIIRATGAEHGDLIRALKMDGSTSVGMPRYHFELVEKRDLAAESDVVEFTFGIVRYREDLKEFVVEENALGEMYRVDGTPATLRIPAEDVQDMSIKEGDAVDISWYKNNPTNVKVRWVHQMDSVEASQSMKMKLYAENDKKSSRTSAEYGQEVEQTLDGKAILLVGLEPKYADLRLEVERLGGSLEFTNGKLGVQEMAKKVRKKDLIVIGIAHISHRASIDTVKAAKQEEVPFITFSGYGKDGFLREVHQGLASIDANS